MNTTNSGWWQKPSAALGQRRWSNQDLMRTESLWLRDVETMRRRRQYQLITNALAVCMGACETAIRYHGLASPSNIDRSRA